MDIIFGGIHDVPKNCVAIAPQQGADNSGERSRTREDTDMFERLHEGSIGVGFGLLGGGYLLMGYIRNKVSRADCLRALL